YVGTPGSVVALDFNSQTNKADQLIIGGSASGSSVINVLNLTPGAPFTLGPTLIDVKGASTANFTLNAQNFGGVSVVLLPQNNGASIALATVPNATGTSGAVAVVAAQTVAFQSADI